MNSEFLKRLAAHPLLRAAIVMPLLIMVLFSLFNLTGIPDEERLPTVIKIGIVNLDEGVPEVSRSISAQLLARNQLGLLAESQHFTSEEAAKRALDTGDVSAILIFPAAFSREVMTAKAVNLKFIASQHLSLAETQFTGALPRHLQMALSAMIPNYDLVKLGSQSADEFPAVYKKVAIAVEYLHFAERSSALAAPGIMTFVTWMAAFVGSLMTYLATRGFQAPGTRVLVCTIRTLLPVAVSAAASLVLTIIVVWATNNWDKAVALWLFTWFSLTAANLLISGLFSLLGIFAVVIALPTAFYQSVLSGTQVPISLAPDWLRVLAELLPFSSLGAGYRALVIGGPEGSLPLMLLMQTCIAGLVLIFLGSWLHQWRRSNRAAAVAN